MLSGPGDFMALYKHLCKEAAEGKYIPNHNIKFENRGSPWQQKRPEVQRNLVSINSLLVSDILNVVFHCSHPIFTTHNHVGLKLCKISTNCDRQSQQFLHWLRPHFMLCLRGYYWSYCKYNNTQKLSWLGEKWMSNNSSSSHYLLCHARAQPAWTYETTFFSKVYSLHKPLHGKYRTLYSL